MRKKILLLTLFAALAGLGFYHYSNQDRGSMHFQEAASTQADVRILMLDNSLSSQNNLDQLVKRIVESIEGFEKSVFIFRIAPGGYNMIDHRDDLVDANKNGMLRQLLLTGSDSMRKWDYVTLQDQSQLPGFDPQENQMTSATFLAATEIHEQISLADSTSVLLMTWGFWDGDSYGNNRRFYPDFLTMNERLELGYRGLARQFSESNEVPPIVVPVGLAYRAVYEEEIERGIDPKSEASLFRRLYVDDRHPSIAGSYLAASVIVGSLFDVRVTAATWVPVGLDPDEAARLRRIAHRVSLN